MPGTAPAGWQTPKTDYTADTVLAAEHLNRIEGNAQAIDLGSRTVDPTQAPSGNAGTLRNLLDWLVNRVKAITGGTNWYDAPVKTLVQLWAQFHESTGHKHSGAAGDAPNVPWTNISDKPSTYAPAAHKTTHAVGGSDTLTPADIGAETPSGAQAKVDTHANGTSVHSATSAATADRIMLRDGAGRAKVAAPAAADDIARKDTVDNAMPVGTVIWYAKNSPPTGYLECNGSAVSRTTYSALYGVIGVTFGAGDGSSTFNVPDLRAEFIRGWDHGRGVDASRAFGSAQAGTSVTQNEGVGASDWAKALANAQNVDEVGSGLSEGGILSGGSSYGHRVMSGLRPRNVALLPCIRH